LGLFGGEEAGYKHGLPVKALRLLAHECDTTGCRRRCARRRARE